jgi:hypothetical protein
LHHDAALTEEQLADRIKTEIPLLQEMGAAPGGRYGFVHGMFALAGSDPRHCSIHHELDILLDTGCYADFTFPSLSTPSQPRMVNTLYHAQSTGGPKPHDSGELARVGRVGQGLLIFQGPMWAGASRRFADDGHVASKDLPHAYRIRRWLDSHVHVKGRPNWVFIAVHGHTAKETEQNVLFSGPMSGLWSALENLTSRPNVRLHYVTAREAYNIVRAAQAGRDGNPHDFRDFEIPPPENRGAEFTARGDSRSDLQLTHTK